MTVRELQEHLKTMPPDAKLFYYGGPDGDELIELHEFQDAGQVCYATKGVWSPEWYLGPPSYHRPEDVIETRRAFIQ